jgi:methyl-accepting chemotaxis protein
MPAGGGFVNYYWSRPGSTEPVPKMSRVHYEPWNWDVTTGVYIDDIDTAFRESLLKSAGMLAVVWWCCGHRQRGQQEPAPHHRRRPEYVGEVTQKIAEGDLSVGQTHASDQRSILYSVKSMQQRLAQTIGEIRHSAETIATASSEIASGNMDLSARTESQASSLEETAASMEELTRP